MFEPLKLCCTPLLKFAQPDARRVQGICCSKLTYSQACLTDRPRGTLYINLTDVSLIRHNGIVDSVTGCRQTPAAVAWSAFGSIPVSNYV